LGALLSGRLGRCLGLRPGLGILRIILLPPLGPGGRCRRQDEHGEQRQQERPVRKYRFTTPAAQEKDHELLSRAAGTGKVTRSGASVSSAIRRASSTARLCFLSMTQSPALASQYAVSVPSVVR